MGSTFPVQCSSCFMRQGNSRVKPRWIPDLQRSRRARRRCWRMQELQWRLFGRLPAAIRGSIRSTPDQDWVRINLAATAAGVATQPMSQALQEYPEMKALYERIHATLAPEGGTVQMLGRLGYAEAVPASPRWPLQAKTARGVILDEKQARAVFEFFNEVGIINQTGDERVQQAPAGWTCMCPTSQSSITWCASAMAKHHLRLLRRSR